MNTGRRPTVKLNRYGYLCSVALHRLRIVTTAHERILLVPLVICALIAVHGCTRTTTTFPTNDSFARISTHPADDAIAAADLFPEQPGMTTFQIIDGNDVGTVLNFVRTVTDRFGASWASDEGELRTDFWNIDDDGRVLLTAVYDASDRSISRFDPPLSFPRHLAPGQPHREEVAVRVVKANNPSIERASGSAVRTVEYIDNQRIRLPSGDVMAQRLVSHLQFEMGLASAEITTTSFIVPGVGLVAKQSSEHIRVLGVFGRSNTRTVVRIEDVPNL